MTRPYRLCTTVLFTTLCLLCTRYAVRGMQQAEPAERVKNVEQIKPGMTAEQVRDLWGRPDRVARQILYRRYLEQWSYEQVSGVWIEFDCLRGQEPRVLTVHSPGRVRP